MSLGFFKQYSCCIYLCQHSNSEFSINLCHFSVTLQQCGIHYKIKKKSKPKTKKKSNVTHLDVGVINGLSISGGLLVGLCNKNIALG